MMGAMITTFTSTASAELATPVKCGFTNFPIAQKLRLLANRLRNVKAMQNQTGSVPSARMPSATRAP